MSDSADVVRAISILIDQEALRQDRGWDYPGIWATVRRALDEDGRSPRQIVQAGYAAIDDAKAETPAAIRWASRYTSSGTATDQRAPKCHECGRSQPAHEAAESKLPADQRHPFEVAR